jgi:hypothetical protein
MERITFDPKELTVIKSLPMRDGIVKHFDTPVTPRENLLALYRREIPCWMPKAMGEVVSPDLDIIADHVCRGPKQGLDIFGVEWEYVPTVGGSMVKPGAPKVPDITEWEKYVTMPDVDSWDWEGCYERNKDKLDSNFVAKTTILTGFFERLISLMDFQYAAVALIDEELQESVHRLFNYLCGIYEKMIDYCKKYFNVEIMCFHDDWGSQRESFFSYETCEEMIFPYIKRIVDYMHSKDIFFDFHCCGKVERLVPLMIKAGMDSWAGQEMNDKFMLHETYGSKLIVTIPPCDLPVGAGNDETYKAIDEFVNKCGPNGGVMAMYRSTMPEKAQDYIYELSRKKYNQ